MTVLTQTQYIQLLDHIERSPRTNFNKVLSMTLVIFIVNTGLRAMEISNLTLQDIDLINGIVSVWLGKGNKNRRVGLNQEVISALQEYLKFRLKRVLLLEISFLQMLTEHL